MKFTKTEEGVEKLINAVHDLLHKLNLPTSIGEAGVDKASFDVKVKDLAEKAFGDQTTTANPRMPLIEELEELYRIAY